MQKKCEKSAELFGQFRKRQYLCTRFRPERGLNDKQMFIERLSIIQDVVQESTQVLREKDTRNCNEKFPSNKYTIDRVF